MLSLPNLILVISGPSGAGKSTLCDRFTEKVGQASLVVTATTRTKRANEVDGVDYYFVDRAEFQRRVEREEFLEYAEVHGNFYGSPLAEVKRLMTEGQDVILEIDVQGGLNVRKKFPSVLLIYVTPSNLGTLKRRLRGRATEDEEEVARRIAHARCELESLPEYDYILINDELDEAVSRLREIIRTEKSKIARYERGALVKSLVKGAEEFA